jgi:hypothetical protein
MNILNCKHGEDGSPISYWCNGSCWEAKGSSSRFIEHYMKGIKAVGRFGQSMPIDSQDFGRCVDILKLHPEWIPRLPEMAYLKEHKNWSRLVKHWNTFMMLYDDLPHEKSYKLYTRRDRQKFSYFSHLLQGITTDHGLLLTHKLRCNSDIFDFKLNGYLVVGSLVLQEKNQDDEYDLYTSMILDVFPEIFCKAYRENGQWKGSHSTSSYLPRNIEDEPEKTLEEPVKTSTDVENEVVKVIDEEIKGTVPNNPSKCTISYPRKPVEITEHFIKQEIINKLHNKMDDYIKQDPDTWQTTNYHYCPHYTLYANGETPDNTTEESFKMYYADVYPLEETPGRWKLGTCIISITDQHKLHPLNKNEDEFEVIFNDEKWVVSGAPVKLYTYYDEGIVNCSGDEEPEVMSSEELEKIIEKNKLENIRLELEEKRINDNSTRNPVQNFGFVSIRLG